MAAAPKRSSVLRMAERMAPAARKTGEMSMRRVSSTVSAVVSASKPGTRRGTTAGAKMARSTASTSSTPSIRLRTVEATRQARSRSPWAVSPASTGTRAEAMAPAATSWKTRSGIRKAA